MCNNLVALLGDERMDWFCRWIVEATSEEMTPSSQKASYGEDLVAVFRRGQTKGRFTWIHIRRVGG